MHRTDIGLEPRCIYKDALTPGVLRCFTGAGGHSRRHEVPLRRLAAAAGLRVCCPVQEVLPQVAQEHAVRLGRQPR